MADSVGILLLNYGEPQSNNPSDIRSYLYSTQLETKGSYTPAFAQKVIATSAATKLKSQACKDYKKLWTDKGFYYDFANAKLRDGVATCLRDKGVRNAGVLFANRHPNSSIKDALSRFKERGIKRLLVFPLLPQYSYLGNGGILQEVERLCNKLNYNPTIRKVLDYHNNPAYTSVVARSILNNHLYVPGETRYLFIYPSVPCSHLINGDVYEIQTGASSLAIAEAAGFKRRDWTIAYLQKQNAKKPWLSPSIDDALMRFCDAQVKDISLVCPGYPVDRGESLLEVADAIPRRYQRLFARQHGEANLDIRYVHCLNACNAQVDFLSDIIIQRAAEWL